MKGERSMHVQGKKKKRNIQQLEAESEFQGSVTSLRRQLKSILFTSQTSTDKRTFLWTRITFLPKKKKEGATLDKQVSINITSFPLGGAKEGDILLILCNTDPLLGNDHETNKTTDIARLRPECKWTRLESRVSCAIRADGWERNSGYSRETVFYEVHAEGL
jgi:hypothetical protein